MRHAPGAGGAERAPGGEVHGRIRVAQVPQRRTERTIGRRLREAIEGCRADLRVGVVDQPLGQVGGERARRGPEFLEGHAPHLRVIVAEEPVELRHGIAVRQAGGPRRRGGCDAGIGIVGHRAQRLAAGRGRDVHGTGGGETDDRVGVVETARDLVRQEVGP